MPALLVLLGLVSALRTPGPLSPRIASYRIEARLDAPAREVAGTARLTWRNTGTAPVGSLPFHLYMNAFKNERSRFFARLAPWEAQPVIDAGRWGFCRVIAAAVRRGDTEAAAVLRPLVDDESLAELALARPVAPGETIEVTLTFVTRLPAIVSRAGVHEGFFAVAQWFPKIGVYACDPTCAFRAAPYTQDAEFFADFGVYDVELDVPADLVVGATGVLVEDRARGARRTLAYHAEDVHDFAWAAGARLVARAESIDDGSGLPPVEVRFLSPPELAPNAARHFAAVRAGLAELGERLGSYPYGTLTIVDVPPGAEEAGGMEYPTIFFTEDSAVPVAVLGPELVTAHELAHQWFQGMLASDEADEPWLDEGLAELATGWVAERLGGRPAAVYRAAGHELTYVGMEQIELGGERADPIATASDAFRDRRSYAELSYRKPALLLATIEARVGARPFAAMLRAYADAFRFKHPRGADLVAALAGAPAELRALLDDALHRAGELDYAVTEARTARVRPPAGLFDADGGAPEERTPSAGARWRSEIVVERLGEQRLPVTVRARFADGTFLDRALGPDPADGPRWRRIALDGDHPLIAAELHPLRDTPLDTHRWNDGRRVEADPRPRRRLVDSARLLAALLLSWVAR